MSGLDLNKVTSSENDLILNNDIIYEIIQQLGKKSFNWLLVNRYWSKIAVIILWKNPFKICEVDKGHYLIRTYISCFNEEERTKFNGFIESRYNNLPRINVDNSVPRDHQTTFYEYGKYLEEFNYGDFRIVVDTWANTIKPNNYYIFNS